MWSITKNFSQTFNFFFYLSLNSYRQSPASGLTEWLKGHYGSSCAPSRGIFYYIFNVFSGTKKRWFPMMSAHLNSTVRTFEKFEFSFWAWCSFVWVFFLFWAPWKSYNRPWQISWRKAIIEKFFLDLFSWRFDMVFREVTDGFFFVSISEESGG